MEEPAPFSFGGLGLNELASCMVPTAQQYQVVLLAPPRDIFAIPITPKKPTVSYEELTKTQTQWDLEAIQNTPIESSSKKRRKQLKKAGLLPKQGHNG